METKPQVRVALYIRVSTDDQDKNWYWKEMQLDTLKSIIKLRSELYGWHHDKKWLFEDNSSWSNPDRPWYKALIKGVRNKEFDMIAVYKIDRLSRNLSDLLDSFKEFEKSWIGFYSVKENIDFSWPIWKLTFHIFWALAEFERALIISRTSEWKAASAKSWNYTRAWVPFWYKKVNNVNRKWKTLEIIPEEAFWIKQIFSWFINEKKAYTDIANLLNTKIVKKWIWWLVKSSNSKWYDTDVRNILSNTAYIWIVKSGIKQWWEDIYVSVPKIISEIEFQFAQRVALEISENYRNWWGQKEYLLQSLIEDFDTGRKFVWVTRTKWGYSYRRKKYIDKNWKIYDNLEIPAYTVEDEIWKRIMQIINDPKTFYEEYMRQNFINEEYELLSNEKDAVEKNLDAMKRIIYSVEMNYLSGKYSEEKRDLLIWENEEKAKEAQENLEKLYKQLEDLIKTRDFITTFDQFSFKFNSQLDDLEFWKKKVLVNSLIDKIVARKMDEKFLIQITFKFKPRNDNNDTFEVEPKNPSDKPHSGPSEGPSSQIGTPCWDRTSNQRLRRPLLYPLS